MTQTHVFQLLGVAYTVIGIAILANPTYYKQMLDQYIRSLPVIFFNACMVLAIGYLLLMVNSSWKLELPLFVTIIGWLALLKGIFILIFPQPYLKVVRVVKLHYLRFEAILAVILGIALLYAGFAL